MSTEDALFRVVRAAAKALLDRRLTLGEPIDLETIADEALRQFGMAIDLRDHVSALRARLAPVLDQELRKRRLD